MRRGLRQFFGVSLGGLVQESQLLAVAPAPFANARVQPESRALGRGQRAIKGFGLGARGLTAIQRKRSPN